jgi:uncharacterized membrane protein
VAKRFSPSAIGLVAMLGSAGVAHFVKPEFFDPIVPKWMPGKPRITTYVSGAVEIASAVLVARPSTRKLGGWLSLATFIGVYPANIQAALDGGMKDMKPPFNSAAAAWARLPMQFPMFRLAWRVARGKR